jgi:preprotein translocase subunit SecE
VSKKADKLTDSKDDAVDMPAHVGAEDVPVGTPEPRAARFGEGGEGGGGRRERGVAGPRAGFFTRISQFLRDVRAEMNRVSWPTPNEVKNTTIITLIAVIFFAIYLFAVDQVLSFLITQLIRLVEWLAGGA